MAPLEEQLVGVFSHSESGPVSCLDRHVANIERILSRPTQVAFIRRAIWKSGLVYHLRGSCVTTCVRQMQTQQLSVEPMTFHITEYNSLNPTAVAALSFIAHSDEIYTGGLCL